MSIARIAIVRLSALGDIINSAVVLQFIKQAYPGVRIEWITEAQFAPILQPHPDLDAVHGIALKQLKRHKSFKVLRALVRQLRALGPYDLVIDMQGLIKSAVVSRLAGSPVIGFSADSARERLAALFYTQHSTIPYETNIIRRNCELVSDALDFHISDQMIEEKAPALFVGEKPESIPFEHYIAIVVGASWPSKCYPPERFAEVCDAMPHPCLLIWGNDAEKKSAETIASLSGNAHVAPAFDLAKLRDAIAYAALTIGGDTGPTHLAWALNRPSVVLFGPTTPRMMFETPRNVAIESNSEVDILHIDKHDMSIGSIPPETVIQNALELL